VIMKLILEQSTNIKEAYWYQNSKILFIVFMNDRCYQYSDVDEKVVEEWQVAESSGKFFHSRIKSQYDCIEVTKTEQVV